MKNFIRSFFAAIVLALLSHALVFAQDIRNCNIIPDLTYKIIDGTEIKLDLYSPITKTTNKLPLVVFIHGGGWDSGDKSLVQKANRGKLLQEFLDNNYIVASIDYRLTSKTTHFPAPAEDCKDAIKWLRMNAESYNIDTNNIGLWGTSAGGHLALLVAYTSDKTFVGDNNLDKYSANVSYVIDHYGPVDLIKLFKPEASNAYLKMLNVLDNERYEKRQTKLASFCGLDTSKEQQKISNICGLYSPINYVSQTSVPTIILQGSGDNIVELYQAKLLRDNLEKNNTSSKLVIFKGGDHGLNNLSSENEKKLIETSVNFAKEHTTQP